MHWIYICFVLLVIAMLALDLGVFHRHAHSVGIREALMWSAVWIAVALGFSVFVYFGYESHFMGLGLQIDAATGTINNGRDAVLKYLTGYVIEKSLSVDNIFVIAMIFASFAIPAKYQHRVLFWGIFGALAMRGAMIGIGSEVIARYHWVLYIFGLFLILTAIKMLLIKGEEDVREGKVVKWVSRLAPMTPEFHGSRLAVRVGKRVVLTPLGFALIVVEVSDLVFAVDSIPAIFAITADPFLVFTSNVFAILGLRSLYFALAGMLQLFRYLKPALAVILALVGLKMIFAEPLKLLLGDGISLWVLALIVGILAVSVIASLVLEERDPKQTTRGV